MKKAFTLIELMIVIVILGMLTFVLFSAYNKISEISFRIERQRKVNEEVLFTSEILQNYANRNSIDFDYYTWINRLDSSKWFTSILYLSWEDGKFSIYSSWSNCIKIWTEIDDASWFGSGCGLYMKKEGWAEIKLTNDWVYFSEAKFKIIPYFNSDSYYSNPYLCKTNFFSCLSDDWFRLFVDVYPKAYIKHRWSNNVHLYVQQFFNIN